jgi:hypothetical protein
MLPSSHLKDVPCFHPTFTWRTSGHCLGTLRSIDILSLLINVPVPVAARLLRLWVRIPPGAWMSVCCEFCVLSGRGLCDGLIICPGKTYRVRCVWVWSWSLDNEEALAQWGAVVPWGATKNSISDHYMHTWRYVCVWSCIANPCTLYVHGMIWALFLTAVFKLYGYHRQTQQNPFGVLII